MNKPFHSWYSDDFLTRHSQFRNGSYVQPCADFEMNYVECMEAYGYPRAEIACRMFQEDLWECTTGYKRMFRVIRLRSERARQVLEGERHWKDFHGRRPEADSYPFAKSR